MPESTDKQSPMAWLIEVPEIDDIEIQVLSALGQVMARLSEQEIPVKSKQEACRKRVAWWFQQRFGEGGDA